MASRAVVAPSQARMAVQMKGSRSWASSMGLPYTSAARMPRRSASGRRGNSYGGCLRRRAPPSRQDVHWCQRRMLSLYRKSLGSSVPCAALVMAVGGLGSAVLARACGVGVDVQHHVPFGACAPAGNHEVVTSETDATLIPTKGAIADIFRKASSAWLYDSLGGPRLAQAIL